MNPTLSQEHGAIVWLLDAKHAARCWGCKRLGWELLGARALGCPGHWGSHVAHERACLTLALLSPAASACRSASEPRALGPTNGTGPPCGRARLPTTPLGAISPPPHWVPHHHPLTGYPNTSHPATYQVPQRLPTTHPPIGYLKHRPPTHRVPQHHPPIHWMSQRHHPPTHPVPAKRVHLLRQPRLRLGVGCQQVQREGQGVGRRLVARRNERVALGAGVGWGGVSWGWSAQAGNWGCWSGMAAQR